MPESRHSTYSFNLNVTRVRDRIPWRVWIVAIIVFWERAAFWGITAPWQNYMENPRHHNSDQRPGALGLGQSTATRIYCLFYIFYYLTPILAAVLADSTLGRYKTLVTTISIYVLGCLVLTISSLPSVLDKGWGLPGLAISMVLIGLGGGGFRVVAIPFMIDQYAKKPPLARQTWDGNFAVIDYELTVQFICNIYYWVGNVGSLSWFATVYLERHYTFSSAYGLALGTIIIAMLLVITGGKWFAKAPTEGNVLPSVGRIIVCACKCGFSLKKTDPQHQRTYFNRAVPWSSQLILELSSALQACRVLLGFVTFYVCFDQMQNNLISQAGQLKTNGTPNDLLPAINQVGCIIFGPIVSLIIYPQLFRRKVYPTPIERIVVGFIFVVISMLWATILQLAIYKTSHCDTQQCVSSEISVWIQAPVYLFLSIGEVFALTAGIEYAHNQSPKGARVVVQAIHSTIAALGSAVAMSLTPVARNPHLVIFYASLTGAMAATTLIFWILFRHQITQSEDDKETRQVRVPDIAPQIAPIETVGEMDMFSEVPPPVPRRSSKRPIWRNARSSTIKYPEMALEQQQRS
ncbi:MFS general substrate transporter [Bimuria novae-zelandiae CBS 107.79]|uniref:MFS general substrate transporter n=1 Tax=Bimuria novae-zelandiae CBS 107.79 TaxID=1447943 RepID=A0A6A5VDS0_9PLEO|nr:MFS general substrate transporter [Bimuria novae-zelandiae CBS 107.79]